MQTIDYPTLKMNWINYVLVPKVDFKKLQAKPRIKKETFPKVYTETDEEWTWETIDFWPKWISAKELYLLHDKIENDRSI